MKATDITSENISFLFKGPFGFGKTLAAVSFALTGPTYLSYWDKKQPVEIIKFFRKQGELGQRILDNLEWDVYSGENAGDYLNFLIRQIREGCRYTTLINDSLTFMTAAAVHWSQNFGKNPKSDKKFKDVIPDFDEYKVETNLISQCIDLSRKLPCNIIWTAHPIQTISISGQGSSMRVTKVNPLVSYGTKVASMIPGSFTEIYHFAQQANWNPDGKGSKRYIVQTEAVGDEFAKSPLLGDYVKEFDITDKLFYSVWKELVDKSLGVERKEVESNFSNPFQQQESQWKV